MRVVFSTLADAQAVLEADLLVISGSERGTRPIQLPAAIVRRLFVATRYLPNKRLQELAEGCIKRIYDQGVSGHSRFVVSRIFICSVLHSSIAGFRR